MSSLSKTGGMTGNFGMCVYLRLMSYRGTWLISTYEKVSSTMIRDESW